jgi:exopolysaccharide/PEP-CTERM locus tyrosine autokinase
MLNSFRELRTELIQHAKRQNFVLMVTSVLPDAGSTFVSVNLGAVIAMDQSKTALVIDGNLYDPAMSNLFEIGPDYGLTDFLEDDHLGIEDIIYSSGVRRLRVVPVGNYNEAGAELFASRRMEAFMGEVKERYADRFVIVDTPPLANSAEAKILADYADYILLVVPYGMVTDEQINQSVAAIDRDKFVGCVFNDM